ncbi:MAG: hypothetical protein WCK29_03445 [archaeon]
MVLNTTSYIAPETNILSSIIQALPASVTDKLSFLIDISKILMIVLIIYFVILIISKIFKLRDSFNLSNIAKNVEEINEKLSSKEKKSVDFGTIRKKCGIFQYLML